jgi:endoglucanase
MSYSSFLRRTRAGLHPSRAQALACSVLMILAAGYPDLPMPPPAAASVSNREMPGAGSTSGPATSTHAGGAVAGNPIASPAPPATSTRSNPFDGARLWVDPNSNAAKQAAQWRRSRSADAAVMDRIATRSHAIWFGDWNAEPYSWVRQVTSRIRADGALPVYVLYNLPLRDCGLYSRGGAAGAHAYQRWISEVVRGIGAEPAIVVLEPDGIATIDCFTAAQQAERLEMIRGAVRTLNSTGRISVYIDAGNARWHPAALIADRLNAAGIGDADGFALNVSNFVATDENIRYGDALSAKVGGKHFVIDTSRNGLGPTVPYEWCNPAGRALGVAPTTRTGHAQVDAFLWVKPPGESGR